MSNLLKTNNNHLQTYCLENSCARTIAPTPPCFLASSGRISKTGGVPPALAPSAPRTEAKGHFQIEVAKT